MTKQNYTELRNHYKEDYFSLLYSYYRGYRQDLSPQQFTMFFTQWLQGDFSILPDIVHYLDTKHEVVLVQDLKEQETIKII